MTWSQYAVKTPRRLSPRRRHRDSPRPHSHPRVRHRCHRLHPDRCGHHRPAWHVCYPANSKVDTVRPVCLYNRLSVRTQFFASLSYRTLAQVALALVIGVTGLVVVLVFAYALHLDPGTAAGLAAGSLTQTSMMGTASGAMAQLGLPDAALKQGQANIAAGYAVTYICGGRFWCCFMCRSLRQADWASALKKKQSSSRLSCRAAPRQSQAVSSIGSSRHVRTA